MLKVREQKEGVKLEHKTAAAGAPIDSWGALSDIKAWLRAAGGSSTALNAPKKAIFSSFSKM